MIRALLVMAILAGCGGSATTDVDITAVRANFRDECRDPIVLDDLFCEQVQVSSMSMDGSTLVVPTTLNESAGARGGAICAATAELRFDAEGNELGFDGVRVLDMNGERMTDC